MGDHIARRKRGGGGGSRYPAFLRDFAAEIAGQPLLLASESCWLVILSTLDLFMTYLLLRTGMNFYESNPVAQWWFARWNIAGMTVFKFLVVSVAIVSCEVVERRRPGLGRRVIGLGILAAGAVVAYSVALFFRHVIPAFD
jgi:hypothetical protein